ncbi:hypothetical protein LJB89_04215, partial [Tyzzerella sp. OttesenSCG-928-J15]|nr:hypothetical protein [Tyzzerella sp. OttesenSCG-928-J15]
PVEKRDFCDFDLIIAMDNENIVNLNKMKPANATARVELLSFFTGEDWVDVPDPWYTGDFNLVYQMLERAMSNILIECTKN